MTSVEETLHQREARYGDFSEHAAISRALKRIMANSPNWSSLTDDKQEALEMIAHKIARILNGDSDYSDSWHDIGGYSQLVERRLVRQRADVDA